MKRLTEPNLTSRYRAYIDMASYDLFGQDFNEMLIKHFEQFFDRALADDPPRIGFPSISTTEAFAAGRIVEDALSMSVSLPFIGPTGHWGPTFEFSLRELIWEEFNLDQDDVGCEDLDLADQTASALENMIRDMRASIALRRAAIANGDE